MKTISTLRIISLMNACPVVNASVLMIAIGAGCAGAYTPVPKAAPRQPPQTKVRSPESATDNANAGASTSVAAKKSQPVVTALIEPTAKKSADSVAQSSAPSIEPSAEQSAEPSAAVPVEPTTPQTEATHMQAQEQIQSASIPPEMQPEVQPEVQAKVLAEVQPEVQSEVQPKTEVPAEVQADIQTAKQPATITPVSRDPGAFARQNLVLERANTSHAQVVLIGDSITEGWEGAREQLQSLVGLRSAANLGVGGDRTQHVLWRLEQAPLSAIKPKVVVVMIGTNNIYDDSADDIVAGIRAVAELIHQQCPYSEILVLDIPPRGEPTDSARAKIAQINTELAQGVWPEHARFVRVGDQFLRADATIDLENMPDLLHFSQKGYAMWATAIKPELDCSLAANHPQPAPSTAHP